MNFGARRVLNDHDITPHSGFSRHPHRDMEIISYIVKGKLTHWDSVTKIDETIFRGHVQAISAGSGIWHSELNKQDDWCRFLQIWIMPPKTGGPVRYNHQQFELKDRENKLLHIVGNPKNKESSPLYINSNVNLYVSELTDSRAIVEFELKSDRQAYINCIEGSMNIEGYPSLNERDSQELTAAGKINFSLQGPYAHFIIIEMESHRNTKKWRTVGSVDLWSTNFVQSKSVLSKACVVHIVILCKRRITQRRTLLDEPAGQHLCMRSTTLSPAYVE
ncbi:MAG: redox-sensitive bicupin YhaK (pirin superfamily) [Psychromonas sp.]|jgi:redox-sensitive bicupin YhaK (pirin superfamily)